MSETHVVELLVTTSVAQSNYFCNKKHKFKQDQLMFPGDITVHVTVSFKTRCCSLHPRTFGDVSITLAHMIILATF